MDKVIFNNLYRQQVLNPAAFTTGTYPTSWIDAGDMESFAFLVEYGASNNSLDLAVYQATTTSGGSAKAVSGASITQLSGTDDNKQASITVSSNKLDMNNSFRYVACRLVAPGTTTGSVVFYGYNKGEKPVTQPTAFTEQVEVVD